MPDIPLLPLVESATELPGVLPPHGLLPDSRELVNGQPMLLGRWGPVLDEWRGQLLDLVGGDARAAKVITLQGLLPVWRQLGVWERGNGAVGRYLEHDRLADRAAFDKESREANKVHARGRAAIADHAATEYNHAVSTLNAGFVARINTFTDGSTETEQPPVLVGPSFH